METMSVDSNFFSYIVLLSGIGKSFILAGTELKALWK